jgi:hypothetical protein
MCASFTVLLRKKLLAGINEIIKATRMFEIKMDTIRGQETKIVAMITF